MTGFHLRLDGLLRAAIASLLIALAAAGAASARVTPPTCSASSFGGAYPPPACVHSPYKSDPYATQLGGQQLSLSHRIVGHGRFAYELVTVKASFSDALQVCPQGDVPVADIPCQQGSVTMGLTGRYLPKHRYLSTIGAPTGAGVCTSEASSGTCSYSFRVYENVTPGLSVYVMAVSVGEITQNPGNDLGSSGFQFPVAVTVPKPRVARPR